MELDVLDYIIDSYEDTYDRCLKIGIGNKTEFNTIVSYRLLDNLRDRMTTLKIQRLNLVSNPKNK
jgi:hypothetical protein